MAANGFAFRKSKSYLHTKLVMPGPFSKFIFQDAALLLWRHCATKKHNDARQSTLVPELSGSNKITEN
jgi:hypothetical protein